MKKQTYQSVKVNVENPIIWADVPDIDVIRVGDVYYMSSTMMHMNPGVPIMKSSDLVHWEVVNYVYDILEENDEQLLNNGKNEYGLGSWASSLRFHNNTFYLAVASFSADKTYIFQTDDIENGDWKKSSLNGVYHDMSLLIDEGHVYMIYGGGDIKVIELTSDATAIKEGGLNKVIIPNASLIAGPNVGLPAEGAHIQKINGMYYVFLITWPKGEGRTQLMFRSDCIDGEYEGRIALDDAGIAQGGIVDTVDGDWYAMLFQDCGAVGRTPFIIPVEWEDGWPVHKNDFDRVSTNHFIPEIVSSDEFDQALENRNPSYLKNIEVLQDKGLKLPLVWQWNHNPDSKYWSLSERPGYLRIKNGRVSNSILDARNILTQRTFGPQCSGQVLVEISHMKDGDFAGLAAFQENYGFVAVKATANENFIVMVLGNSKEQQEIELISITNDRVYFKVDFDFKNMIDQAYFYYSLDEENWHVIGEPLQMKYTIPHFMGYRFALFNYATKTSDGFVDFDYFRVTETITEK
ncbi:glycoside hydrolase 43 family protein [Bacillus sp. FJAT-49732]|uniref:Glycoside hydrolase 43 family protein n=1 Tax=Lederbergia citrisecunda TaxID=2833583 RepID=A0A942YMA0_9BACI|nr:glycoside hydrolase 43 family protein [Lederbergia citrisecunda]MBS4200480.1 glycoside hydrolase 43 family protein [Lederbergia citrisecunda]